MRFYAGDSVWLLAGFRELKQTIGMGFARTWPGKAVRGCVRSVALLLALGIAPAFAVEPPSPGTILKQTTPQPAIPTAPKSVLTLPPPARQEGAAAAVKIPVRKIVIQGNRLLPTAELEQRLQGIVGRTVTLGELRAAAARLTALYRAQGYPLAYAYIPAQSIRDGAVAISVVEPRYDRIDIGNTSRLKSARASRTLGLHPGEPIASAPLDRGLLLLHRTPGLRVAGTLVPGAEPATSTLQVKLSDAPRLRAATTFDNYGNIYTGRTRAGATISLDNPLGYGSQLAVNGLVTEGNRLHAGGFSAVSPDLVNGLRAGLYGSRTDYRLGGTFADLHQRGHARQIGLDLSYPVILQPGRLLNVRLDVTRNTLEQKSSVVGTENRSHITLARFSVDSAYADRTGGLTTGGLSISRGTLSLDSPDAHAADAAGPNAAGSFWVAQGQVRYQRLLPLQLQLNLGVSGQLASHNLDGSEKFYLGGPDGVMSYPIGEAGGDQGVMLQARLGHQLPIAALPGRLDAALLAQAGKVWINHDAYPGFTGANRVSLTGAGLGLDYHWRDRAGIRLTYVHQLDNSPATAGPDHGDELWASLQLFF